MDFEVGYEKWRYILVIKWVVEVLSIMWGVFEVELSWVWEGSWELSEWSVVESVIGGLFFKVDIMRVF
jgi:hypothetical protein